MRIGKKNGRYEPKGNTMGSAFENRVKVRLDSWKVLNPWATEEQIRSQVKRITRRLKEAEQKEAERR